MRVERLATNPIIRPNMDARMGDNVNGPSVIRVPGWIPNPLGISTGELRPRRMGCTS